MNPDHYRALRKGATDKLAQGTPRKEVTSWITGEFSRLSGGRALSLRRGQELMYRWFGPAVQSPDPRQQDLPFCVSGAKISEEKPPEEYNRRVEENDLHLSEATKRLDIQESKLAELELLVDYLCSIYGIRKQLDFKVSKAGIAAHFSQLLNKYIDASFKGSVDAGASIARFKGSMKRDCFIHQDTPCSQIKDIDAVAKMINYCVTYRGGPGRWTIFDRVKQDFDEVLLLYARKRRGNDHS